MMRRVITSLSTKRQFSTYVTKRESQKKQIESLSEIVQKKKFENFLNHLKPQEMVNKNSINLSRDKCQTLLTAGIATFLLHVEARIASFIGQGFYTIGPCGEELMGTLAIASNDTDAMALHYRHVSTSIARQLEDGRSINEILLDRARGFTCSINDPVTGGVHCALGGGDYDFYVTSTLASQCPPALGRALGIGLSNQIHPQPKFPKKAISIVSLGDGSTNNAMFLATANLARYSQFRGFKCPLLFVVTNNDICISLKGYGSLPNLVDSLGMKKFYTDGDGKNIGDMWDTTTAAIEYVRKNSKPAILVVDKVPRRFGHAATDRQSMYLTESEIEGQADADPLREYCQTIVNMNIMSADEIREIWNSIDSQIVSSFSNASEEPKVHSRSEMLERTKAKLAPTAEYVTPSNELNRLLKKPQPMRVLMNAVIKEILDTIPTTVYIGEDVRHGGYYRVTDDIAKIHPLRIQDFPPDETTLIGVGMGFSQCGLTPIVEIPYAKYLDCGADMFFESIITHWCTNGRQKDGMVIRLQGFDKGVFGGNFHTHNSLYLPPGLDVVCYSNGRDYVRGMRHAVFQAQNAGRIIMSVDSTDLLHRRNLFDDDDLWLDTYPTESSDQGSSLLDFETVVAYPGPEPKIYQYIKDNTKDLPENYDVIIFTYGNGVPTALRARKVVDAKLKTLVVDCPTLGVVSEGMIKILEKNPQAKLVFADVCKIGQNPFAGVIVDLQSRGILKKFNWDCVGASPTYNPLGSTVTFLSEDDIIKAIV